MTRTVSTTAVVIRADETLTPSAELVVAIELPLAGCLTGRGRIVRILRSLTDATPATFAVEVRRYRLGRRDAVLGRLAH